MILFSIIIPIYGVEKYIDKALSSIYSQGLNDNCFEVIAINDGTLDNSMLVVEPYRQEHNNLIVYNQSNAGVSVARNKGLEIARGKFVTFLDPDDWLVPNSLIKAKSRLSSESGIDIMIYKSFKNGAEVDGIDSFFPDKIYTGVELFLEGYTKISVWGAFYRLEFLQKNKILFSEGVAIAEDSLFFSICQACNSRISFEPEPLYIVYERDGSASNHKFTLDELTCKYVKSLEAALSERTKIIQYSPDGLIVLEYLRYRIFSILFYLAIIYRIRYQDLKSKINFRRYLPIHCVNKMPKMRFKIRLMNFSPLLFYAFSKVKHL